MFSIYLILILKIQFHIQAQKSFLFGLVGIPVDGNFVKRDSIEYFKTIFKPLFLCFHKTGNDINDARYPCKVTLILIFLGLMDNNQNYLVLRKECVKVVSSD